MNRHKKPIVLRISAWLLSSFVILALVAGCVPAPAALEETPVAPAEPAAPAADAPAPEEGAPPAQDRPITFDPPITVNMVRSQPSTAVYFPEGDTAENNRWTRALAEQYGINVEYLWLVDPSQMEQRTNLMLASGELPDVFMVNNVQFNQLAEAGQIADLTEVYATHVTPAVDRVMTEDPLPMQSATLDGRLMAIPFTFLARENVPQLYIRTDWLENLGLEPPQTMAELLAISEAFTTQDPDGNGVDDTWGLGADETLFDTLKGFFNGYNAYRRMWIEDGSGGLAYSSIQPEVREALLVLQELQAAGQIDPEFGVKNFATVAEDIIGNKIGMYYGVFSNPVWPLQLQVNNNPGADWQAYPIPGIDGPASVQVPLSVNGYWVVRAGYEHPEAVIAMLDFFLETFYFNTDQEVFYWFVDGPGESEAGIWQNAPVQAYRSFKNLALYENISLNPLADEELTPEERKVKDQVQQFLNNDEVGFWGWNKIYGENGSMSVIGEYRDQSLYVDDQFITAPTTTMTQRWATLQDMEDEVFTRIVLGAPIEEFDTFVEQWQSQGGAEITAEVNAWFAAQ